MTTTMRRFGLLTVVLLAACSNEARLTALQVSPPAKVLPKGLGADLSATAIYSDGTKQDVTAQATFTSSEPAVATVAGARVSTVVQGVAQVTASWSGLEARATITVTDAALLGLEVVGAELTMPKGTSVTLQAVGRYSDGTSVDVTGAAAWSCPEGTLDLTVAGKARGAEVGHGRAVATLDEISGALDLDVTDAALVSMRVATEVGQVPVGLSTRVAAYAAYTDGSEKDVSDDTSFASTDAAVIAVDADRSVRALQIGTAAVAARFAAFEARSDVAVIPAAIVGLRITPDVATVGAGGTVAFQAFGRYSDGAEVEVTRQVIWSTTESALANLSNGADAGTAYAFAAGTATVYATLMGGSAGATAQLQVTAPDLVGVALSTKKLTMSVGDVVQVQAIGTYSDGSTADLSAQLAWEPLTDGVVSVQSGLVTALSPGKLSIWVYDPVTYGFQGFVGVTVLH